MYVDDEEEDAEGTVVGLPEQESIPLQVAEPAEAKASADAAAIIRRLREAQCANDSPSKRLDALAGNATIRSPALAALRNLFAGHQPLQAATSPALEIHGICTAKG